MKQSPKEILETMLGALGFAPEVQEADRDGALTLEVNVADSELLTAEEGKLIEDLQFLVNRVSQAQDESSPKAYVDVNGYRAGRNDRLIAQVRIYADSVRATGVPFHLEPMNAYDRRLVHHAFRDDPVIMTTSPSDDARIKRITLRLRSVPVA